MGARHKSEEYSCFVIIQGDPINGFKVYGIYPTMNYANDIAETFIFDDNWWIMPVRKEGELVSPRLF